MRYVCSRCHKEVDGGGGELIAHVDTGKAGGARKLTAAICDECFSSLVGWLREGIRKASEDENVRRR